MKRLGVLLASFALVAASCGSNDGKKASPSKTAVTGSLNVFAAASLTEAFTDERAVLPSRYPGLRVVYNFAGSQALVTQVQQGAPADVFASADQKNMQKLVDAGLVDAPQVFARNELEIVVAPGNPKHLSGLADLARSDLIVVLEDPSVPAGSYSQQALQKAGVTVRAKSLELDVRSALAKVTSGEADAAIVYVSDVSAAGDKAQGVQIPDDQNVIATYPMAVIKATKNRAAADAFVAETVSGAGRQALERRGFLPPV